MAATVHIDHIHNHPTIDPHGIVSTGPALDFSAPHDRERLGKREAHSSGLCLGYGVRARASRLDRIRQRGYRFGFITAWRWGKSGR